MRKSITTEQIIIALLAVNIILSLIIIIAR